VLSRIAKRAVAGRVAKRLPMFKVLSIAQVALLGRRHLQRLEPGEARRITELVRRGRHLSEPEKEELRILTAKLEPRAFAAAAADHLSPVPLPRRLLTGAKKKS
jgi:hypothetical protein